MLNVWQITHDQDCLTQKTPSLIIEGNTSYENNADIAGVHRSADFEKDLHFAKGRDSNSVAFDAILLSNRLDSEPVSREGILETDRREWNDSCVDPV